MSATDERLVCHARRQLDLSVAELPPAALDRLAAGRRRALTASRARRTAALPRRLWRPLVFATTAGVALLAGITYLQMPVEQGLQAAAETDLELLLSSDDLELYRDLDFYLWLTQIDEAG